MSLQGFEKALARLKALEGNPREFSRQVVKVFEEMLPEKVTREALGITYETRVPSMTGVLKGEAGRLFPRVNTKRVVAAARSTPVRKTKPAPPPAKKKSGKR